jgi:hypothetical protein
MKGNIATKHAGLDHKNYKTDRTHHKAVTSIKPVLIRFKLSSCCLTVHANIIHSVLEVP